MDASLIPVLAAAASAGALLAPSPLAAATIELEVTPPAPRTPSQAIIRFTAEAGEKNTVAIARETPTSYLVRDVTAPIRPARNCALRAPAEARCTLPATQASVPFTQAIVSAQDGDDSIDLSRTRLRTTVFAGTGDDVVRAPASGMSLVDGEEGNDVIRGGAGADTLLGGAGDDVLIGGAGIDDLDGDALRTGGTARGGNDRLLGGRGKDLLRTAAGRDRLDGQAGADTYVVALLGRIRGGVAADTGRSPGDGLRVCVTVGCEGSQCRGVRIARHTVRRGRQVVTHRGIERLPCNRTRDR